MRRTATRPGDRGIAVQGTGGAGWRYFLRVGPEDCNMNLSLDQTMLFATSACLGLVLGAIYPLL